MSKKYSSEEAFYSRMRSLANINESKNEKKSTTLGNLIDYKRGSDNIAYGIVKENHNYYIKKSNKQNKPNVEDFAYIGGLENIHEYKYNKFSEADKNRTMLLNTINEALNSKKNVVSESKTNENAEDELAAAEKKLGDAEKIEKQKDEPESDNNLDIDAIDLPTGEETPEEPEGGEETPEQSPEEPEDSEETPEQSPEELEGGEETPEKPEGGEEDSDSQETREIQKLVGKLTNKIRNVDLTPTQAKSYLNSFISSVEDELPDLEVEERKEIANKILKVDTPDKEELEDTGIDDELDENKTCNECGFAKYAKDRGYDSESIMECNDEEMASLMNGYALQEEYEINEEDLQSMALFSSPEIQECLSKEYGNDTLPEQLKEYSENITEQTSEDKKKKIKGMFWWEFEPQKKKDTQLKTLSEEDISKYENMSDEELAQLDEETLNELNLAGVKNVGKYLGKKAGDTAKDIGKGVKGAASAVKSAIGSKIDQATQKLDQIGDEITQEYQKGVKSSVESKLQKAAKEFGELIVKLDNASKKAGEGGINRQQIIMQMQGILKGGGVNETAFGNDPLSVETQPNINDNIRENDEEQDIESNNDEPNGEEINSPEEFNDYAITVLKQAHGEDFDPEKAEYMIKGLTNMVKASEEEDWGAAVGILQQSLDESMNEQEEDNSEENNNENGNEDDIQMTPGFEPMGGGIPKPDSADMETEEAGNGDNDFEIKDSTVNINMNESEKKLRKYIRSRLEEKSGLKKSSINEDKKSDKIKKLDNMIDEQYDLFKSIVNEEVLDEGHVRTFEKVNPNDPKSVEKAFNKIFRNTLSQYTVARNFAKKMSPEDKYKVMKQGMEKDKLKNPKFGKRNGEYVYLTHRPDSGFKSGGTGGKTSGGGV